MVHATTNLSMESCRYWEPSLGPCGNGGHGYSYNSSNHSTY